MAAPQQSVYENILEQALGLNQAIQYQFGLGKRSLELAAEMIHSTWNIVLIAVEASYSVRYPFFYRIARWNTRVHLENAVEFCYFPHLKYDFRAFLILISRSCETIEIVKALQILNSLNRRVIGLTNEVGSTLAKNSDISLIISGSSDYIISIQTHLTSLLTLHNLAEFITRHPESTAYQDSLRGLIYMVKKTITKYHSITQAWKIKFTPYQTIYLLARCHSLAIVYQGALLFHEMARYPDLAFNACAFRHVPWEVLDELMLAFVCAPDDETRAFNIALATNLCVLGSPSILITSQLAQSEHAELQKIDLLEVWDIPVTSAEIAPFLEIMPIDFFIYEYARW